MSCSTVVLLLLMISAGSAGAQSTGGVAPASPEVPITPSPLNGNWNITGNRQLKQFPLLSMHIQLNGTQIIAHGDHFATCPDDPRRGGGGSMSVSGEIASDGSFTLTTRRPGNTFQIT
jgi:hypothetical protein